MNAKDKHARTPLHFQAYRGHREVAELLIASGADVNARDEEGSPALVYALSNGHTGIAELLIAKGADVNAKQKMERLLCMRRLVIVIRTPAW